MYISSVFSVPFHCIMCHPLEYCHPLQLDVFKAVVCYSVVLVCSESELATDPQSGFPTAVYRPGAAPLLNDGPPVQTNIQKIYNNWSVSGYVTICILFKRKYWLL